MRLYFCQLMLERGKVAESHPGYQAEEMKEVEFVVPFPGTGTGKVGDGLGSTRSQDDGAAATRDAARTERKREVSMLGIV